MRTLTIALVMLTSASVFAECTPTSPVVATCVDQLGWLPLNTLRARDGLTLADLEARLGKAMQFTSRSEADPKEPGAVIETVQLSYPAYEVVLERQHGDELFWLKAYSATKLVASEPPCSLSSRATRPEILVALKADTADALDAVSWSAYWCDGTLSRAAHATISFSFGQDETVAEISWEYWAD